jgi:hypothetical protein
VNELDKTQQKINCLQLDLARERMKKRKQDTRNKIQLGGLVIKASMHNHPKDVLLGALIYCRKEMQSNPALNAEFKALGCAAMQQQEVDNELKRDRARAEELA